MERFNQTPKNGLREHLADGLPFSSGLTSLQGNATCHDRLGPDLQLALDRIHPQMEDTPVTTPSLGDRVAEQQHFMKQQTKCPGSQGRIGSSSVDPIGTTSCSHSGLYHGRSLYSLDQPLSAWLMARVGMPATLDGDTTVCL